MLLPYCVKAEQIDFPKTTAYRYMNQKLKESNSITVSWELKISMITFLLQSALEVRSEDEEVQLHTCSRQAQSAMSKATPFRELCSKDADAKDAARVLSELPSRTFWCCKSLVTITTPSCTTLLPAGSETEADEQLYVEITLIMKCLPAVVDDLLNTFLGVDGRYIRARVVKRAEGLHLCYILDCEMDTSMRDMARRLLPLRCTLPLLRQNF